MGDIVGCNSSKQKQVVRERRVSIQIKVSSHVLLTEKVGYNVGDIVGDAVGKSAGCCVEK